MHILCLSNISKFLDTWVSLIDGACEGYIFDWATLLYNNLAKHILSFHTSSSVFENKIPPFYMYAYIMDCLCFSLDFLAMGWKWNPYDPLPIHVYHNVLCDSNYFDNFYEVFHRLIMPIYEIVFEAKPPKMSPEAMDNLKKIGNKFGEGYYIRFLGSYVTPHFLPLYIHDQVLCREVDYQKIAHGITKALKDCNRRIWSHFPLPFRIYSLANYGHAEKEVKPTEVLKLTTIPIRAYDLRRVA